MGETADIVEIAEEEKKYDREWLLFEVTEVNDERWPVKGRLLCHSESRDEIHQVAMKHRNADLGLMTRFVGDPVPPGMYVVL